MYAYIYTRTLQHFFNHMNTAVTYMYVLLLLNNNIELVTRSYRIGCGFFMW